MFIVNSKTDDLLGFALNIITQGFNQLLTIHLDNDTNVLVYIFSNGQNQFAKASCEIKDINVSISSLFKSAYFFEEKLEKFTKLNFENSNLTEAKQNYNFRSHGIEVDCLVKEGQVSHSRVKWHQKFVNDRFISFDELLSSLSDLDFNSYTYQVMALGAFEDGLEVSKESISARMILVELDKIKSLVFSIDRFISSSNLKAINLKDLCDSFIKDNISKANILSTHNSLFSDDLKKNYIQFMNQISSFIELFKRSYLNNSLNQMQLKSTKHPLAISTSSVSGALLRSSGVSDDYNTSNDIFHYTEFETIKPSLDKNNSLYSFYIQISSEINQSLSNVDIILNSGVLLTESYDNFSFYDLNNFNMDSCFEMENGHGLAAIYLFKDSSNKIGYQLNTESLRRLYYYLDNVDNIDFENQILVLEALDIKLQELY